MNQNGKIKTVPKQNALILLSFLKNAYDDYLAARTLLNHNLILQGTILATTSIEKYFKAILTFKGDTLKHSHSLKKLLPSIKNFDSTLYNKLDIAFLELIDRSYNLRYIDSAPARFKIDLSKRNILANLDYTISLLHDKMKVQNEKGEFNKSIYQNDLESKREELITDNYLFNNQTKEEFIKGFDFCYQINITDDKSFVEIYYQTEVQ
ncbi:HEPN domain-containing protein [Flavobacterium sp. LB2P6]|uniref:HEPN domain-containing protein n=1 Tax=Flavobacterium sp. LB2P6 TaxID=3401714 RepID=UPI003AABE5FC